MRGIRTGGIIPSPSATTRCRRPARRRRDIMSLITPPFRTSVLTAVHVPSSPQGSGPPDPGETDDPGDGGMLLPGPPRNARPPLPRVSIALRLCRLSSGPLPLWGGEDDMRSLPDPLLQAGDAGANHNHHALRWTADDVSPSDPGFAPSTRRPAESPGEENNVKSLEYNGPTKHRTHRPDEV